MKKNRSQLDLPLRQALGWGGRRAGAGRPIGPNPQLLHRSREKFHARFPCHVTLKVRREVPSLRSVRFVREFERSLAASNRRDRFRVVHYSIQSDHVHLLVEASGREALGRGMKSISARLARAANRVFRRTGAVLRDRYHLRVLRTPREVRNALAYVLLNARRHLAKRGRRVPRMGSVDPASSGRWFSGWRQRTEAAKDPPAVVQAGTWLLSRGWKRHGRIGLVEVPGVPRAGTAKA